MKKTLVYVVGCLILIMSINACLKYKEFSDVKGLELDVQGATPLFSYTLTIQDLFFKIIRSDSGNLSISSTNNIYSWTENINDTKATSSPDDSLYKNVPVGSFIGADSVSFKTSGLPSDIGPLITALVGSEKKYTFPSKQGKMQLTNESISIIKLNNISGKLILKVSNTYTYFPINYTIKFIDLKKWNGVKFDTIIVSKTGWLAPKKDTIHIVDIPIGQWIGSQNNVIKYNIENTVFYTGTNATLNGLEISDLEEERMKVEDTFFVEKYEAIFGDVGSNRYLFRDNFRQKLNITDPFILDPNNDSRFPNIGIQIDYNNHTLGIDAKAVLFDAKFKMKDGTEKPLLFFNQLRDVYDEDSLLFPLGIARMGSFGGPAQKTIPGVVLDTSNTNFQELNLNLRLVDTLLYKVKFYSLRNTSEDTNSFISQSSASFVNSASGKLTIPYVLSSIIRIDTSKTSVVNIPDKFYADIDNIIKNKNGTGELQDIELSMTIENYTVFSIIPQVYFMNNDRIIDSFSRGQRIPPATLSPGGIVRLPNSITIAKKLTATQWEQLKQCNRLTSNMVLETSSEEKYPAITKDMYIKFYFKIGNISFKYLIKK